MPHTFSEGENLDFASTQEKNEQKINTQESNFFYLDPHDVIVRNNEKNYRIAIATNTIEKRDFINISSVRVLEELAEEYGFELIHIECSGNFEWVYHVGEFHEEKKLDLLIGVGWEASEIFLIIHSKYDDLNCLVIDNRVPFSYIKSVYFSRFDCSYIIGAMMATDFPNEKIFV